MLAGRRPNELWHLRVYLQNSRDVGLGPAQGRQKLTGLKVCLVHSEPLLELNSDLH